MKTEKRKMLKDIAYNLISIWTAAFVRCSHVDTVTRLLQSYILNEIHYVQKYRKKILSDEEKRSSLIAKWNNVLDIAKCTCFVDKIEEDCKYEDCKCSDENKLVNFPTYIDQVKNKSKLMLFEEEKSRYEAIFSHANTTSKPKNIELPISEGPIIITTKRPRPQRDFYANLATVLDDIDEISESTSQDKSFNPVIEECMYQGVSAEGIMRILNTFILAKKLPDDFICTTAVRTKMDSILTEKNEKHSGLQYLAFDGRKDQTLFPKNQHIMEEHVTFIKENSYISHCAVSSKKSEVVSKELIKVLKDTNSVPSIKILDSDGEPANTGHLG